jgi:hypothetical protein
MQSLQDNIQLYLLTKDINAVCKVTGFRVQLCLSLINNSTHHMTYFVNNRFVKVINIYIRNKPKELIHICLVSLA